ncbi:DUF515 domain-containing protein [Methanosphaera sp. WGK6]|uniref:DUF515 domain-containing protein n=1 Tax=Methanosphaera sp. WGK6 TaxID=1561964 RepID=UPI00084C7DEE|nr:DUF515 domain-containing protein [Methanosphaera sp. WGK6]OED29942.1 hypothetical protein NL43_05145 [Methanosphaera sp. WGK6]
MKKSVEQIKSKLKLLYNQLDDLLFVENNFNKKSLRKRNLENLTNQNKELFTGIVVVFLILTILFSICYYFLIFSPNMAELNTQKSIKINEVNSIFEDNLSDNSVKQALLSRIDSASSMEELEQIDVEDMAYPVLKNQLLDQLDQVKDKYNRVELTFNGTSNIMSVGNATVYINSSTTHELADMKINKVDSVIIPISINRKRAASGLVREGDVVDIYMNNMNNMESSELSENENVSNNSSVNSTNLFQSTNNQTSKLVGGSIIVSILRSKDSGSIDSNIEFAQSNLTNISQSSNLDIEQILSSKSVGSLNDSQLGLLLNNYGWRLSDYERLANLGDLDVEYIIMVEVPRDSVENILKNMDNIILTIPTYDAPSWVNLSS